VHVEVVGWLRVQGADGTEIDLGGALERRVLTALVLRPGRGVPLDALAEAVFGDEIPTNADVRLRHHVSRLRRRVGSATVLTVPGGYRLNTEACEIDSLRFEKLVSTAIGLVAEESSRAGALLGEALALWRGTPFADLEDWPPARMAASELDELRRVAEEERAGSLVASGRSNEAVGVLDTLVADEPLRERRWSLLMLALYRCGRQADALRAFQRARAALGELGLEPGRELRSLERDISVQDDSLQSEDVRPSAHASAIAPQVGGSIGIGDPPTGTVTFLFTDVEDSTQLWERHPTEMRAALARHDEILHRVVGSKGGLIFSTGGDGIAAAFQRSVDAVGAAVEAQLAMQAEAWPEDVVLRVRMGAHTGEAQERDGSYFGPPLNRAARVMGAAHGGQIVVSRATAEVLGRVKGIELADLGSHRLKGLAEAVQLFEVTGEGLTRVDRPLATAEGITANLPRPATEFVGRVAELQHRSAELPKRRLVTLTGAGGVGKTRLATEIGWLMVDAFPGGVWLVELASVADPASVVAAVASTLSVPAQQGMSMVESVVDWLRGRRLLLIVDNCEHVLEPVVDLVGAVVAGCPTVTVLATSREALGVPGERVHVVPSLDPAHEGVELFCDRAVAADGSFAPDPKDRSTITAICRRLDGMPLAIELAAARIRFLTPSDLLAHLDDRFRLLRRTGPGGLERHQTLRAVVTWSYQLITEQERVLFDRLSVFAGGFDLAAARSVCAAGSIIDDDVADVLGSLVGKSMVVADLCEHESRYRLLETLRQYGEERLRERGETVVTRWRHFDHYLDVATRANELWASPRQLDGDAIFDREWDNLRGAHTWAIATESLGLAESLVAVTGPYAWSRLRQEHGDWASRTLGLDNTDCSPKSVTYGWAANWAFIAGDHDGAIACARHGIEVATAPEHPDTTGCWSALTWAHLASGRGGLARQPAMRARTAATKNPDLFAQSLAQVALIEDAFANDHDAATEHVDRYARWAERVGSMALLAQAAFYKGQVKIAERSADAQSVMALYRDGLELARKAGDLNNEGKNLVGTAIAAARFQTPEASAVCRAAITRLHDNRHWSLVWTAVDVVARWLAATGKVDEAAVVYGHLEAHHPIWDNAAGRRGRSRGLEIVRRHQRADQLMARGAAISRDEFITFVLDQLAPPASA
jgi:predicted ATPase/class 3 adenylate cyclase